jgi:hypothetical protein
MENMGKLVSERLTFCCDDLASYPEWKALLHKGIWCETYQVMFKIIVLCQEQPLAGVL